MGITGWVMLTYVFLLLLTIFAFAKGEKALGAGLIAFMLIGAAALWWLWVSSPM